MTDQQKRANTLIAAAAAVLAMDTDNLWPDDIRALESAMSVGRQLARRGKW